MPGNLNVLDGDDGRTLKDMGLLCGDIVVYEEELASSDDDEAERTGALRDARYLFRRQYLGSLLQEVLS